MANANVGNTPNTKQPKAKPTEPVKRDSVVPDGKGGNKVVQMTVTKR
jgi:hypothetical protein